MKIIAHETGIIETINEGKEEVLGWVHDFALEGLNWIEEGLSCSGADESLFTLTHETDETSLGPSSEFSCWLCAPRKAGMWSLSLPALNLLA